ncbi:MAG: hypothetical protein K0S56_921 [Microvirga sp.]|jgi:hypothetical protein|nr:hypothetical protein [Microvirga sp.]
MVWQDFKMRAAHDAPAPPEAGHAPPAALPSRAPRRRAQAYSQPIPSEDIALLFEAAVTAAMRRGMTRDSARPVALEILRSTLANDPRLPQPSSTGSCVVCGQVDGQTPLVPIMTARPSVHVWLHSGACHERYRSERLVLVDRIIAEAGIAPELNERAA